MFIRFYFFRMPRNHYNKITFAKKNEIIRDHEELKKIKDIAELHKLPRTTITSILTDSHKIKQKQLVKGLSKLCRVREEKYPDLKKQLFEDFKF